MRHILISSLLLCSLLFTGLTTVEAADDEWKSVFKFQSKMAEFGSVKAQYILGEMYEEGRGVKQDYAKAIEWYRKAEKSGHKNAANRISQLKAKIANAKLNKKLATKKTRPKAKKQVSPRKKIIQKKKPVKATRVQPKPTVKAQPAKTVKAPVPVTVEKQAEQDIIVKKNRPAGPSYDINRLKGTLLDEAEDAFE